MRVRRDRLQVMQRIALVLVPGLVLALLAAGAARPDGAGVPTRAASARLTFVDLTSDKVGQGARATPDGQPDGHFRLQVTGTGTITGLAVRTTDASGKPCCGQTWNTIPNDPFWILGVFRDGRQLNPADRDVSILVSGSVTLDLYATNTGYFKLGQRFLADATLAGGGTASSVSAPIASLGAPGGGGAGGGGGTTTTTTPGSTAATPPTATQTGTVLVNGAPFAGGTIPFNATVDVTRGSVVLTATTGTLTVTHVNGVSAVFKLLRGTDRGKPIVELRLVKGDFGACRKPRGSRAAAKNVRAIAARNGSRSTAATARRRGSSAGDPGGRLPAAPPGHAAPGRQLPRPAVGSAGI